MEREEFAFGGGWGKPQCLPQCRPHPSPRRPALSADGTPQSPSGIDSRVHTQSSHVLVGPFPPTLSPTGGVSASMTNV